MSRKKREYKSHIEPDPIYSSIKVSRFINKLMMKGKKSVAQSIVYTALESLSKEVKEPPITAFEQVLKNVSPILEVKSRRVGGSTYQVPVEVNTNRGLTLAMRWIVDNARKRSGRTMDEKLTSEFVDAFNKVGASIKKREDTHKMAEANKAFAHFRW